MKVVTLDTADFNDACGRLLRCVKNRRINFDTLVGIATGGDYVAAEFDFPETFSVKKQRPSTSSKQGIIARILPHLPTPLLDRLRILEARWLARSYGKINSDSVEPAMLPDALRERLRSGAGKSVLVVDDAVDSGNTLLSVVKGIRIAAPDAEVHTAVMTQTFPKPVIEPDVALWNDGTLIRFPWSKDAKQK